MTKLYVWKGDVDWIIAEDKEDILKVYHEHVGETNFTLEDISDFTKLPMNEKIKVTFEDGIDGSGEFEIIEKTARKWIKHWGRGFLCSTEW